MNWRVDQARTDAFDSAILSAGRRDWHPLAAMPAHLAAPFDLTTTALVPDAFMVFPQMKYVADRLDTRASRIRFINDTVHIYMSDILHGERAGLAHAARLCLATQDLGAQEHAANQAREEARHATAFSFYIGQRWGEPAAVTPVFGEFLDDIASSGCMLKEIAGVQVLLEGLAMGTFTALDAGLRDPLARHIIRQVMADEASHLKTGAIWMKRVFSDASPAQREATAMWTGRHFLRLSRGLFAPTQHPAHYESFGLDPRRVSRELRDNAEIFQKHQSTAMVFRTAAKAVARAGLISPRTRSLYAAFLN